MPPQRSTPQVEENKMNDLNGTFRAIRQLADLMQHQVNTRDRHVEHGSSALKQFRKMESTEFEGSSDPLEAEV